MAEEKKRKKAIRRVGKTIRWLAVLFFGSTILVTLLYRWVPVPYTPLMAIRSWENRNDDEFKTKKQWVSIDNISHNLVVAVIASEDNNFLTHNGFDWEAIDRAIEHNKQSKRTHGASTISQQVAKNVFLWPKRSYFRKGLEVYFTFLVETLWSKKRIMEVYLNVIEMGRGIYGAEAAAQTYFKKPAKLLTRAEAALIAACLPSPQKRNPAQPTAYVLNRQAQIMRLMSLLGTIDLDNPKGDKKDEPKPKKKKKK